MANCAELGQKYQKTSIFLANFDISAVDKHILRCYNPLKYSAYQNKSGTAEG